MGLHVKGISFNDHVTSCTENKRHIPSEYLLLGICTCFARKYRKDLINNVRLNQDRIDVKIDTNGNI